MLYEIQTRLPGGIWKNCWTDEKTGQPEVFDTEGAALLELSEYLAACTLAVADGDIVYHVPDDYRVAARYL